jgi:hypothetical protein
MEYWRRGVRQLNSHHRHARSADFENGPELGHDDMAAVGRADF